MQKGNPNLVFELHVEKIIFSPLVEHGCDTNLLRGACVYVWIICMRCVGE
jgi:hypothetical protein